MRSAAKQWINSRAIRIRDWRFLVTAVRDPKQFYVHLLDAYVNGYLEIDYPLVTVFRAVVRSAKRLHMLPLYFRWMNQYSLDESRTSSHAKDIKHHYDLQTSIAEGRIDAVRFFRLWLDKSMTYSMGYWPPKTGSLEEAQHKKLSLYQNLLDIHAGHDVYEAGFGFGSFIPYVMERKANWYGANLSTQQCRWVRKRYPSVQFREQDFLLPWQENGKPKKFDRIITIGAMEHIQDLAECFKAFHNMLKPNGKILVHLITLDRDVTACADAWFGSRIFPNGQFHAHQSLIKNSAAYFSLDYEHVFPGIHYATTLHEWSRRFEKNISKIRTLGAPPKFIRLWRAYFAVVEAVFSEGIAQNSAFLFSRRS